MPVQTWLDLVLLVLVVVAAGTDLAVRKIPNRLLLGGWCAALGMYCFSAMPASAIGHALGGAAVGLLVFLPLYVLRGMAAGDVKLMATVGLFLGPLQTFEACVFTWCAGGLIALVTLLYTRRLMAAYVNVRYLLLSCLFGLGLPAPNSTEAPPSVGSIPYGLAIALATLWMLAQRHPV